MVEQQMSMLTRARHRYRVGRHRYRFAPLRPDPHRRVQLPAVKQGPEICWGADEYGVQIGVLRWPSTGQCRTMLRCYPRGGATGWVQALTALSSREDVASIQAVADSALGVRLEITWNPYREGERGDAAAMVAEVASRTLELRGLLGTHLVSAAPLTDREVADAHRDTACGGNQGSGEE